MFCFSPISFPGGVGTSTAHTIPKSWDYGMSWKDPQDHPDPPQPCSDTTTTPTVLFFERNPKGSPSSCHRLRNKQINEARRRNLVNLRAFVPETLNVELSDRTKSFPVSESSNGLLRNSSQCNSWNSLIILCHFSPGNVLQCQWVSVFGHLALPVPWGLPWFFSPS